MKKILLSMLLMGCFTSYAQMNREEILELNGNYADAIKELSKKDVEISLMNIAATANLCKETETDELKRKNCEKIYQEVGMITWGRNPKRYLIKSLASGDEIVNKVAIAVLLDNPKVIVPQQDNKRVYLSDCHEKFHKKAIRQSKSSVIAFITGAVGLTVATLVPGAAPATVPALVVMLGGAGLNQASMNSSISARLFWATDYSLNLFGAIENGNVQVVKNSKNKKSSSDIYLNGSTGAPYEIESFKSIENQISHKATGTNLDLAESLIEGFQTEAFCKENGKPYGEKKVLKILSIISLTKN
jgi:hypothetical protein